MRKYKSSILMAIICFFVVTFTCMEQVEADECDGSEYACATCTYNSVVYTIESNGSNVQISKVEQTIADKLNGTATVNNNLVASDFIDSSTNMIKCPTSIKVLSKNGDKRSHDVFLTGDCGISDNEDVFGVAKDHCIKENYIADLSHNNNKTISGEQKEVHTCEYGSTTINGMTSGYGHKPGTILVTGYVKIIDGVVTYEFLDGYELKSDNEELPISLFANNKCPDLEMKCGTCDEMNYSCVGNDTKKVCTLTEKKIESDNQGDYKHVCSQQIVCGLFCPDEGGTWSYIKLLYNLVRIVVPVLVIVLGMVDFATVVFSGEDKDMKAAGQRFLKRVIIGVAFILLPFLIDFIFDLVGFSEDCLGKLI